ncbi:MULTISPECIES: GHMP family kinase ATP-binding protein [Massilia]|uniref:GHMP family kinase ATP-binding protein n=1 Tax=Massilia TaxID=149698 RepID=UPI002796894D|nr:MULTISPECIES: hypothetical protein [unclassified Massilia]MDQ1834886.1 hypothetical protein [Massilia sp. CCM 9029]MDQ1921339.1 hypothetical protein [Massilia sp. CCM 9206]
MPSIDFADSRSTPAARRDFAWPTDPASAPGTISSGICHGTLGELIQGPYISDGAAHISLISLPVKKYSCMHFTHGERAGADNALATKTKCQQAIGHYLALHRKHLPPGTWNHDSELLEGKGMASSTADIVATIRCLDAIFGIESPGESISATLRAIERSDSVFLDTYALYLSGRQQVVQCFGSAPTFHACYIDEGNRIDTEKTGARLLALYQERLTPYTANLDNAVDAFLRGDLAAIAACATVSAVLGQDAIPKRNLGVLLKNQARYGADGIFVAHTGSLAGYLYIHKPGPTQMGALSSFFRGLGYQSRFVQTGF